MAQKITPTKQERVMRTDDFIVSKSDPRGIITYCNPIFIEFSGFREHELLGKQHNIVRHPDMPRSIFALLWNTIKSGNEFMGYIKNISKDGSFYWVHATVTPSYAVTDGNKTPEIIGFFSVRRKPEQSKLSVLQDLYQQILAEEKRVGDREQIAAGTLVLTNALEKVGKNYHEFIDTL
jgi:PAS domain S-box-containing protein